MNKIDYKLVEFLKEWFRIRHEDILTFDNADGASCELIEEDQTKKEYYWCLNQVLDAKPNITFDDGADLLSLIHTERKNLLKNIIGGQEETTTGVIRLRAMAKEKALKLGAREFFCKPVQPRKLLDTIDQLTS